MTGLTGEILIGLDPSDESEDAVVLGGRLAELLGTRPRLVTVLQSSHGLINALRLDEFVKAGASRRLHLARGRLRPLDAESNALASDSPAEALDNEAREHGASVIVVGSSAGTESGRVRPGGVGESLLHGAPCAVAIAPCGYADRAGARFASIAVAFDGSAEAWRALETATEAAVRADAPLTVLTVVEPTASFGTGLGFHGADELSTSEREHKHGVLELALRRMPPGLRVEGRLVDGNPGDAIVAASEEFDLLVIGSRGYGPLRRALVGGVSSAVVRRARCPVLVLPRGGSDRLGAAANRQGSVPDALAPARL